MKTKLYILNFILIAIVHLLILPHYLSAQSPSQTVNSTNPLPVAGYRTGRSCSLSDYERLRAEYLLQYPTASEELQTTKAFCRESDDEDSFSLFALLRGCARFVFEAPQCVGAAISTAFDSEAHETDTVLLCAYPLCHYRDAGNAPGDHVFIRLNSRCHRSEINFASGESWLCGPGVVEREARPAREYPEVTCHTVNIRRAEHLDDEGYCEATEVLACMADRAKAFAPNYCLAGTNCGDFSNFLLWCAGYEPRVQFNLNILNNRGVNPWRVRDYTFRRCCGDDLPIGTELSNEDACRVLQQECMPCPLGKCFQASTGTCEPSSTYQSGRMCGCTGDRSRNAETGVCECPKGSVRHFHPTTDATCVCLDQRKVPPSRIGLVMNPAECVCASGLITRPDGSCMCPGEDEGRSSWSKEHGCQCLGGGVSEGGSCRCAQEGNRSDWNPETKSCECRPEYIPHLMPAEKGIDSKQLACCLSEEDFDPTKSPACVARKGKQPSGEYW